MEKGKYRSTPRDRMDDALLAKLLAEDGAVSCRYGDRTDTTRCRQGGRSCGLTGVEARNEMPGQRPEQRPEGPTPCSPCAKQNCLSGWPLAMSYTPDQEWKDLYEIEVGLSHGTIFTELDLPFYPGCKSCR